MDQKTAWKFVSITEIIAVVAAILFDFFLPTLIILGLMSVSLFIRREHISSLGFKRPRSWGRLIGFAFLGAVFLQLFDVGVVLPLMNRLAGSVIDYSGFAGLKGNFGQLFMFLGFSWTLAAVGEEIAYRGYIQKLFAGLWAQNLFGTLLAVSFSSLLFGLAHMEQGVAGVVVTTIDALFFCWLKLKYDNNLWPAIFAHGFYNSVGIIIFYFTGPIYSLW